MVEVLTEEVGVRGRLIQVLPCQGLILCRIVGHMQPSAPFHSFVANNSGDFSRNLDASVAAIRENRSNHCISYWESIWRGRVAGGLYQIRVHRDLGHLQEVQLQDPLHYKRCHRIEWPLHWQGEVGTYPSPRNSGGWHKCGPCWRSWDLAVPSCMGEDWEGGKGGRICQDSIYEDKEALWMSQCLLVLDIAAWASAWLVLDIVAWDIVVEPLHYSLDTGVELRKFEWSGWTLDPASAWLGEDGLQTQSHNIIQYYAVLLQNL